MSRQGPDMTDDLEGDGFGLDADPQALLDENKHLRDELARRDEQIAAVRALADEYWGRATEATSLRPSWRSACRDLRAALDGGAS